jgi:hypothetical protein
LDNVGELGKDIYFSSAIFFTQLSIIDTCSFSSEPRIIVDIGTDESSHLPTCGSVIKYIASITYTPQGDDSNVCTSISSPCLTFVSELTQYKHITVIILECDCVTSPVIVEDIFFYIVACVERITPKASLSYNTSSSSFSPLFSIISGEFTVSFLQLFLNYQNKGDFFYIFGSAFVVVEGCIISGTSDLNTELIKTSNSFCVLGGNSNFVFEKCTINNIEFINCAAFSVSENSTLRIMYSNITHIKLSGKDNGWSFISFHTNINEILKHKINVRIDSSIISDIHSVLTEISSSSSSLVLFGGAFISVDFVYLLEINSTSFNSISSGSGDGGVFDVAVCSKILISSSNFTQCSSSSGNGGVFFLKDGNDINLIAVFFSSCKATKNGGAIFFDPSNSLKHRICLNDCSFDICEAENGDGGAIFFNDVNIISITATNFSLCKSSKFGGVLCVRANKRVGKETFFSFCSFDTCSCSGGDGGALFFTNFADIKFFSSFFSNCKAVGNGGAFALNPSPLVTVCALQVSDCYFNSCVAESGDGGAMYFYDGSSFSVKKSSFVFCRCDGYGGAICSVSTTTKNGRYFDSVIFGYNTATIKGNDLYDGNDGEEVFHLYNASSMSNVSSFGDGTKFYYGLYDFSMDCYLFGGLCLLETVYVSSSDSLKIVERSFCGMNINIMCSNIYYPLSSEFVSNDLIMIVTDGLYYERPYEFHTSRNVQIISSLDGTDNLAVEDLSPNIIRDVSNSFTPHLYVLSGNNIMLSFTGIRFVYVDEFDGSFIYSHFENNTIEFQYCFFVVDSEETKAFSFIAGEINRLFISFSSFHDIDVSTSLVYVTGDTARNITLSSDSFINITSYGFGGSALCFNYSHMDYLTYGLIEIYNCLFKKCLVDTSTTIDTEIYGGAIFVCDSKLQLLLCSFNGNGLVNGKSELGNDIYVIAGSGMCFFMC